MNTWAKTEISNSTIIYYTHGLLQEAICYKNQHITCSRILFGLNILIDFSLTVKAATLIFISGRGSAISSAKQGKSDSIYNLMKN